MTSVRLLSTVLLLAASLFTPLASAQDVDDPLSELPTAQEITATPLEMNEAIVPQPIVALAHDLTPWGMFQAADWVVQAVMIGLVLASVITWTVWLAKTLELFAARRRVRRDVGALIQADALDAVSATLHAGGTARAFADAARLELEQSGSKLPAEGIKMRVAERLQRIEAAAGRRMTTGTGVLATIGSTAPFVGLFGTVWGIMNSFIGIAESQTTNLAVVAPGIAEALLATALGLLAAIPAVVIYNAFARSIGGYRALLGDASAAVLLLVSRDLDRARLP